MIGQITFDLNFYITVIGLILAVVGIWLTVRHRFAGRIALIKRSSTNLFSEVIQTIPELSVSYGGQPVQSRLTLFSGYFVNVGHKDFSPDMVDKPLQIKLAEGFVWKKVSAISISKDLQVSARIADNAAIFDFGLFRRNELFRFDALIEVPAATASSKSSARQVERAMTFHHRIADTAAVKTQSLPENPKSQPLYKRQTIGVFAMMLLIPFVVIPIVERWTGRPVQIEYSVNKDGKNINATATPKTPSLIRIAPIDGGPAFEESGDEFFKRPELAPRVTQRIRTWSDYWLSFILCGLYGFLALTEIHDYFRGVRLYKLIDSDDSNSSGA
ncbi:MAG: hypothetical protein U1F81_21155 [Verrucomicrobiaceae bacterium]